MARFFKPQPKKPLKSPDCLDILRQSHDGRGIAVHQGKTVFVEGALAGEQVSISHWSDKSKFAECRTRTVLQAVAERVEPPCPHYQQCGGCQLQHQEYFAQLTFKQDSVLQQLQRLGQVAPEEVVDPITSPPYGYRRRARIAINPRGQLTFRQRRNEGFVAVSECRVLEPRLQDLLTALVPLADFAGHSVTHIELIAGDHEFGAVLRHVKPLTEEVREWLSRVGLQQGARVWLQADKKGALFSLNEGVHASELEGSDSLSYQLTPPGVQIQFHPSDFIQVNPLANQKMLERAMQWLDLSAQDNVLDLFCGVGNFTLPIATQAQRVVGVEGVEDMVNQARQNAAHNGLKNASFEAVDLESVERIEHWRQLGVNKVLLDPPRAGAKQAGKLLLELLPQRIVYVSCNPASLARDARVLTDGGYRFRCLSVVDMFPHTAHVESMALFER